MTASNIDMQDAQAARGPEGDALPEGFAPAITWLNMSGDVTITWDAENRERVLELVRAKMAEGYAFFVITPRLLPFLGNKKTLLTDPGQLDRVKAVVVPDDQVESLVARLGDKDVARAVAAGAAHIGRAPRAANATAARRARNAEEVVRRQTVAVRPVVGG